MTISKEAAKWYKDELELAADDCIRFYVRYGGDGLVPGFSLGIKTAEPERTLAKVTNNEICFYVESTDAWYFDDRDLHIQMKDCSDGPVFHYE